MRYLSHAFAILAGILVTGAPPARAEPVPVRIGVIPIIGAAPIFVARGEGWLDEAGLKPSFSVFASGPNMIQAFASGTIDVDGAAIREPALSIRQGHDRAIRLIADGAEMVPDQPGTVVGVSGPFADRNPAAVDGLVKAIVKAIDLLKADPARAAPPVEAALGQGPAEAPVIQAALSASSTKCVADPRGIVAATRAMQAFQVAIGTLDKEAPVDGLFDAKPCEKATQP